MNFNLIFEAMPGNHVLLMVNPPFFTVIAVTEGFIQDSGRTTEQLIGKGLFESFSSNSGDSDDTRELNLRASLAKVLRSGEEDQLPVQCYDKPDNQGDHTQRYWVVKNKPVLNNGDVQYIIHTAEDVTAQVEAQKREKFIKGMEHAHNLFSQAPVAIMILKGTEFIIELANEQMMDIHGRGEEILYKPILEIVPEIEAQGFTQLLREVIRSGSPYFGYESPVFLTKYGQKELRYFNFVYQPYYDEDRTRPTGVLIFANDVSDRVTAKKNLQESEQRVRSIVESAPFPIGVYVGKEMRIELANQTLIDAWGKGPDVIGKLFSEILPELDNQEIFNQLDEVFTTGIAFHAKNQRVDIVVDGKLQPFYFNYSFTPLRGANGRIYGVMNTGADVTDLAVAKQKIEKSEAQFRNLVMSAPVGICIVKDDPLKMEVVNDSFLEVTGKSRDAFAGTSFWKVLSEVAVVYEPIMKNVFTTGTMYRGVDHEVMLIRNGREEIVYVNFVLDPIKDADDTVTKVMILVIEVTEQALARRKIEEIVTERTKELAEANINLQRSNAELAQFAYIASHDLQEPLRKVSVFSQMLEQSLKNIDDRSKGFLDKINNSTFRMIRLIRDVLAYSQLSREKEVFSKVDLEQILEGIKSDFDLLIEQKQATIKCTGLSVIEAIPLQMSQLFGNLVSNSLKFTDPDIKPAITITCSPLSKEEASKLSLDHTFTYYNIECCDNGIGFNPAYSNHIFNIFQRLHQKTEYSGTGIGLAMCKKIVQNHHGDIYATSILGRGASFNVILPETQVAHHK